MILKTMLYGVVYNFSSIKEVLAKANERKSGDTLAGIAAESDLERVAAKIVLSELTVGEITENPVVPYEDDSVTKIILDDLNMDVYNSVKNMTVGVLREYLLDNVRTSDELLHISISLWSEALVEAAK